MHQQLKMPYLYKVPYLVGSVKHCSFCCRKLQRNVGKIQNKTGRFLVRPKASNFGIKFLSIVRNI